MTASCFSKYLGNLTVYFDDNGDLKDFSGEPVFLNRSIPEGAFVINIFKASPLIVLIKAY